MRCLGVIPCVLVLAACASSVAAPPSEAAPTQAPTPSGPTPSGPTPSGPTPSGPTPSGPTPSGPTPSGPSSGPAVVPLHVPEMPERPGAIWPPPGGWEPPPCELETVTRVERRGGVFDVTASLRNVTKAQLEVDLPDRCPLGPAAFSGLGDEYDYYTACARGACAGARKPIHLTLGAGQTVELTSISIDPKHGNCNRPLAPGRYTLSFGVQTKHRLCGGTTGTLQIGSPPSAPVKPKPKRACPPQPACGIACPGGYREDPEGCSTCACAQENRAVQQQPTK